MVTMATVRVSGMLCHAPERRTVKNEQLCVTAVVEGKDAKHGNRTRLWQIAAFSETVQSALMHLSEGDSVIVQGTHKAEFHERNGEVILLFGVIAEHVLPLHQPGKKQKKESQAATHRGDDATWPPRFRQ
jgi:single-stranded DNA-binding protein